MTISSAPATSSPSPSGGGGSNVAARIEQLQRQIQTTEQKIADEVKGSDDAKTKLEVTQELELQVTTLQMQIQQLQQEQTRKSADAAATSSAASSVSATAADAANRADNPANAKLRATDRSWTALNAQA